MEATSRYAADGPVAGLPDDASGVLAFARDRRAAADRAEADLLELAVQWAVLHPAETLDDAECFTPRSHLWSGGEEPVTLAGPGAPLIREFCVAEFAAAVGMGTETGKYYLGQAIELRYRLPRLWARVQCGELPAWKARRVAGETIGRGLSVEAAGFVDRQVAPVAHKIRPTGLDRLVEEAIARHMPETADRRAREAADGRRFDIDTDQLSFAGTAAGELARRQLALDLTTPADNGRAGDGDEDDGGARPRRKPVRKTVLFLHLAADALRSHDGSAGCGVGRVENTRAPVTAEQVRAWCGHPDTQLTVKPVIDLTGHVHVEAYEVPDRIAEHLALRDHTCVFPHCTRPARRLRPDQHRADCDHITPYAQGGPTWSCQLAPLCRHHHRIKTHTAWTYRVLEPGSYLWTSPHGYEFLRDHTGTQDISPDRLDQQQHRPDSRPSPRE